MLPLRVAGIELAVAIGIENSRQGLHVGLGGGVPRGEVDRAPGIDPAGAAGRKRKPQRGARVGASGQLVNTATMTICSFNSRPIRNDSQALAESKMQEWTYAG